MKYWSSKLWGLSSSSGPYGVFYGPSTATVGYPSASFTLKPIVSYTGTITPSASSGTFAPPSLMWSASLAPKMFRYTPSTSGTISISASASPSLTILGSPLSLLVGTTVQLFEQAMFAELNSIPEITALLGTVGSSPAIFKTAVPQTYDFGANGPALTYFIPVKPMGHVLTGSDGTATARVQLDAWGYSESAVKRILEAIRVGIDGTPVETSWGDGTCLIISVVQQDDIDMDEEPKAGTDQWLYHSISEYSIKYRVSIPTLS